MTPAEDSALRKLADRQVSASALVAEMGQEGMKADQAAEALVHLQRAEKLTVQEVKPYSSIVSYAWSPYSLWFWATLGADAASIALIFVSSGVVLYARCALGGALVLFVPGYALVEAICPKRELDELTRFTLSIGLSLALVPLIGLVLNYTPFRIRLLPVTASIAGLTVALLRFAYRHTGSTGTTGSSRASSGPPLAYRYYPIRISF